jgi:SAM-dependent methyltransferase
MTKGPTGVMSKAFWSRDGGASWAAMQPLMDRLYQGVTDAVIAAADAGAGAAVLDIGCGGGSTTLAMARRVAPDGRCVGVDVSPDLIAAAQAALRDEPASFLLGDAQAYSFEAAAFDVVMSRFGVMFFDDPVAAFANLRRAVKTDGKLAFACWRSPADNPLVQVPMQAVAPLLPQGLPSPPPPGSPGRFAFADPDRVRGILEASGWRDIVIAPLDVPSPLSADELVAVSLRTLPDDLRDQARAAAAEKLQAYVVDGVIPMVSACWLVTARP